MSSRLPPSKPGSAAVLAASLSLSAGQGGEDRQRVALLEGRVQLVEESDVLIVQVDVDVAMELAVIEKMRFYSAECSCRYSVNIAIFLG